MKHHFTTTSNSRSVYKMSKKSVWITCVVILGLLVGLMTIAAFYDYQIDWILARPELPDPASGFVYTSDVFARIIEVLGTGPCILATIFALMIFNQNAYKIKSQPWRQIVRYGTVVVMIGWVVYACFFQFFPLMLVSIEGVARYGQVSPLDSYGHIKNALTFWSFIGLGLLFSALFIVPTWLILRRISLQTMSELLRYAFILTSASVIAILLVEIAIKPTLQRERFRFLMSNNMVDSSDMWIVPTWTSQKIVLFDGSIKWIPISTSFYFRPLQFDDTGNIIGIGANDPNGGFHPWYALPYTPYGYGTTGNLPFISEDASKSFPSGHETMAAVGFYSLVSLPFTVTRLNTKKIRRSLFIIAVCGSGLVAFGRLLAGAHYLSDVIIGSLIAIVLLIIFHCQYCYGSQYLDRWTGLKINIKRRNS